MPGEARLSGRNSDEWLFGDGIDGVGSKLFKLCAKPDQLENRLFYSCLCGRPRPTQPARPALKICTRTFVVRRTIIEHSAQKCAENRIWNRRRLKNKRARTQRLVSRF